MMLRAWVAVIALLACGAAAAASFSIALLGDTPYSQDEETRFIEMLREINGEDVAFVVHIGDFKNGWTSCGDPVFAQRKEMFAASRHALIYLPGDNEWTDCWRFLAGGYDPLERLARLREIFFRVPMSLGLQPLPLTRQSDVAAAHPYPEHVRWKHGNALFAGFNLPGSDNNLGRMPQEHAQRDAAARDWLKQAFVLAHRDKLGAVVVLFQANPFTESMRPRRGFAEFLDLLAHETMAFDGQVLLVHGDTHRYRVDRPLRHPDTRAPLQNFMRVEVFGSPNVNWVRLRVVEDAESIRFDVARGRR
jgi:hypothetical protein